MKRRIFSLSHVEGKRVIQPDAVADKFWRESPRWYKLDFLLRGELSQILFSPVTPHLTTEVAREVGYDGAKLIKRYKRHTIVDTLGLLLMVVVSAASMTAQAGAKLGKR